LSRSMTIQSSFGDYEVQTGCGLDDMFETIVSSFDSFLLVDENIFRNYGRQLSRFDKERIFRINAEESNKSLEQVAVICEWLSDQSASRSSALVGVGGGITQDLVAFSASVFHRGAPYILVPTTLLAMVDSCIGGKSSINVRGSKNIIGTFQGPTNVFISEEFLSSLSAEDLASGFGEVAKFGLLESERLLNLAVDALRFGVVSEEVAKEVVRLSLEIKQPFIEDDEFDRGIRRTLNYGHSVGHVIESLSEFRVPHGIAVAIGCHIENLLLRNSGASEKMIGFSAKLISAIPREYVELAASVRPVDVLMKLQKDKKAASGKIKLIALEDFCRQTIVETALDFELASNCVELLQEI